MDLGRFERSRVRFWTWIVAPLIVIAAACLPSWRFLEASRRQLAKRTALAAAVVPFEKRLGTTEEVLKKVAAEADRGAEAVDELTRRINRSAQLSGFIVRSLNVDKASAPSEGFRVLRVVVSGQGALPAAIRWLSELQAPGLMLRVEEAKITALSLPPDDTVSADFILAVYVRSS